MTTKKTPTTRVPKKAAATGTPLLFHRIAALLHTMRCIAQYEDQLCILRHEIKNATVISVDLKDEVRELLLKIPSHEYTDDLDAVTRLWS
jgi:hypothetical protein